MSLSGAYYGYFEVLVITQGHLVVCELRTGMEALHKSVNDRDEARAEGKSHLKRTIVTKVSILGSSESA